MPGVAKGSARLSRAIREGILSVASSLRWIRNGDWSVGRVQGIAVFRESAIRFVDLVSSHCRT